MTRGATASQSRARLLERLKRRYNVNRSDLPPTPPPPDVAAMTEAERNAAYRHCDPITELAEMREGTDGVIVVELAGAR